MYTGPSPRNLALSVLLHGGAVAALFNVSLPATPPPEAPVEHARPTEIRLNGKLYYVAQLEGSQSSASSSSAAAAKAALPGKGLAAPRAAAVGRSPAPKPASSEAPAAKSDNPAPAPLPEKIRALRQEARAFIPPEVRPNPRATQTLIQPLSPPDLVPPPTPLPNFRVFTDVNQMRKIPKPFQAPGRRTPPTPAQAPNLTEPSLVLVPQPPVPLGDPLNVLSLNDHPIPFNDKVMVPPGNIAQPPLESTGPAGVAGNTPGTGAVNGGTARAAGSNGTGNPESAGGAPSSSAIAGVGRGAVGFGTGAALVGGSPDGNPVALVGGNGATGGGATAGTGTGAAAGTGTGNGAGIGTGAGTGVGTGTGTGTGGTSTGSGTGRPTPGSPTINRPPTGNFDAVVVQTSPVDQYPESRGMLSGRPIYSVYIPMGTARDWTLFFCVPGEKPESGTGPVVTLGPMGAPVKAPYPTKLLKPLIALPSYEKYVLVHGVVNKDGKFEGLRLVRPIKPETDQALLAALATWEFRAATRDGVAIAVEFLLSIPAKGL